MHLSTSQQERFRTTFEALLHYVNRRLHVIRRTDQDFDIDQQLRAEVIARELWKNRSLIEDFVGENPAGLAPQELEIARGLSTFICDEFIYEGCREGCGIFRHQTGTYLTSGLDETSLSRLPEQPTCLRATLVPVDDAIVAIMPILALGEPSDALRHRLRSQARAHNALEPTASAAVFAQRARTWLEQRDARHAAHSDDPTPDVLGDGFHRGALAGLAGTARMRARDAHYDLVAHESGLHQLLMEARSIKTTIFPMTLRECLDTLDEDWLTSVAEHFEDLPTSPSIPRSELIERICTRMTGDRQERDHALMWCEDAQFDLIRRLMSTNPISFGHIAPSTALKLYPMIPYVFILCEQSSFVAWMPPEVHDLMREVDLDAIAQARKRLSEVAYAAGALASMCGAVSIDAAYERYRRAASDPLDREHFELALSEMERCDTRDSYALWNHEGTDLIISAELSDESALARVVRWSYADRIVRTPADVLRGSPTLVDLTDADEDEFDERLDLELEHLDAARRRLVDDQRDLGPHTLTKGMLEQGYVDYLIETTPLRQIRDYIDCHLPDDQDDYEFADGFARAVVVSILFERDPYDDVLDLIRLFGLEDCEGERYPHALGRLLTDAFNMLPRWDLNGWSLSENTERVTGRHPTPASPLVAAALPHS